MRGMRRFALVVADLFLVELSYLISFFLVISNDMAAFELMKKNILFIGLGYILVFWIFRLYESLWRYASIDEFLCTVAANLIAGTVVYSIMKFLGIYIRINISIIAMILSMTFTIGVRVSFRLWRRGLAFIPDMKKGKNKERALIIGAGSAGDMILREILNSQYSRFNPIAIVDDDRIKVGRSILGVKILGTTDDVEKIAKEKDIDTIIIAMPSAANEVKAKIIEKCKKTGCKLKIIPGLYQILNSTTTIQDKIRNVEVEDLLGRESIKLDNEGIKEYIKDKTVIVTGGGGSIGSELCRQIAKFSPKTLIILDIYENNAYEIQNELRNNYKNLDLKVLIGSIRDRRRLDVIFNKYRPDIVFHAAAHKHVPLMEESPSEAIKNNVFGTFNVAEAADRYGVKRFVMISTDKAVNPTNIMGATKRCCEMIVQAFNEKSKTEFVAVRFGNVLGSNGSVIPLFKKQIKNGGPVTVTHKDITRFFMLIPEAAQLVLQAGAYAKGGEVFVLDMGKPVRIYDLAEDLIRLSGLEPGSDIEIKVTGLRPGEKLYEELLMGEEGLQTTGHEKIFVGKPTFKDLEGLTEELESLKFVIDKGDKKLVSDKLKEIVPTFKDPEEVNCMVKSYDGAMV
ncbi:polysaccharide biosynthesis protein [Clostridium cadaveris]|uniref:polysaccharide biosynthesis protein n=1 Tax=Clostridium cadaveris TaxID=1529 RepID=UPI001E424DCF|nr:nucleoside-diphosphate sugar epimerase/dehydratase [Clostridium cadaveris]UFH65459.1 polysaccharide biosynthesis protein [Clostridium cadaveris]